MNKILSIETSCDETGIAIIDVLNMHIVSESLNSQIDVHKEYGGVFPMMAKREHGINLLPVYTEAITGLESFTYITDDSRIETLIEKAKKHLIRENDLCDIIVTALKNKSFPVADIDAICVTYGPGLEPALWVGISFAKFLSFVYDKPILPINHMKGHIYSTCYEVSKKVESPSLAVLLSGGHTEYVLMTSDTDFKKIGVTRDDAVGEAYDKVARILDLSYPGGPAISKIANDFRTHGANKSYNITLPRPMIHSNDYDMSFSGLKTAVLYLVRDLKKENMIIENDLLAEICFEFEEAVTETICKKIDKIMSEIGLDFKNVIAAGGVVANEYICAGIKKVCEKHGVNFMKPIKSLATDNAGMIGLAGAYMINNTDYKGFLIYADTKEFEDLKAIGNLSF